MSSQDWQSALLEASQTSDPSDTLYIYSTPPLPTSSPLLLHTDDIMNMGDPEIRRDLVLAQVLGDPSFAREVLDWYRRKASAVGWCLSSSLAPSKDDGYLQVSWAGVNKLCTLSEVVAVAGGSVRAIAGAQASHLCHNRRCMVEQHVVFESIVANNSRKGCLVWMECPHEGCTRLIRLCTHAPPCIKYHEQFSSQEDFLLRVRFH
jgi:hypothetical protein